MEQQNSQNGNIGTTDGQLSELLEILGIYDATEQQQVSHNEFGARLHSQHVHDSMVCDVAYSWDGKYLASGCNGTAHVFDAESGSKLASLSDPYSARREENYVRSVRFTPDSRLLVTGGEDHEVKVWDLERQSVKHRFIGHFAEIGCVDVSSNGGFAVSASTTGVYMWDLETANLKTTLCTEDILSVSISPTCRYIAGSCADGSLFLWDTDSTRLVRRVKAHQDRIYSIKFSPCERFLVSASIDKTLRVHETAPVSRSNSSLLLTGHKNFVLSASFSHCSNWIFSASKDGEVRRWDLRHANNSLALQAHNHSIISVSHSPTHDEFATGCVDHHARVWSYDAASKMP